VEELAKDLATAFPGMKGFSRRNLFYIRQWYLFYSQGLEKVPQTVALLTKDTGNTDISQLVPQLVAQIPWGHNREIISKCRDVEEALFYVQQTLKNNWSRAVLLVQMEGGLYKRKGKTLDNFSATLPQPQADLARETFKNPYNFDFLTIGEEARERDLEQALVEQIQKFLLELGQGFAYMGKQYPLRVGESDFFLDLLFYHTRLRCYVVVELKVTEFQPEFAGKLNFYLNVIDDQLRHETDGPSIGILLCKTPDRIVVEYALRNISSPLGVAEYRLTESIPEDLKGKLPSVEDLENELRTTDLK
jgi:predicted nuclease of restriction endonuclease-like (RecB) superfamily